MKNVNSVFKNNIGKHVCKCFISTQKSNGKPFKSGQRINTVKGVNIHPILNIPVYTFIEDNSIVECRRCIIIQEKSDGKF